MKTKLTNGEVFDTIRGIDSVLITQNVLDDHQVQDLLVVIETHLENI